MIFWTVFILTIVYCARKSKRRKRPRKTPRARPGFYNGFSIDLKAIEKIERDAEKAQAQAARRLEKIEREKAKAAQAAQEKKRVDILTGFYEKRLIEKQIELNQLSEYDTPRRRELLEKERIELYKRYNAMQTKSEKLELKTRGY